MSRPSKNSAPALAPRGGSAKARRQQQALTATEERFVNYFVEVTRLLAIPKSVGEVYGLLYCSMAPLTVAEITDKLGVCKATVSHAMRFLANINAIAVTKEFGNRNDLFTATTSLRKLATGFLARRVEPFLDEREQDLSELDKLVAQGGEDQAAGEDNENREFLRKRVKTLRAWHGRGRFIVPVLRKVFGGKS